MSQQASIIQINYQELFVNVLIIPDNNGQKTVALTVAQIPSHTHIQNAHTHIQNSHAHTQAAHNHAYDMAAGGNRNGNRVREGSDGARWVAVTGNATPAIHGNTATNQNTVATNQNTGSGNAHTNLQPYITCFYWRRVS